MKLYMNICAQNIPNLLLADQHVHRSCERIGHLFKRRAWVGIAILLGLVVHFTIAIKLAGVVVVHQKVAWDT